MCCNSANRRGLVNMISMRAATIPVVFLTVLCAAIAPAQVLSDSSLTGKYFARHIEFATDTNNIVTDARSIIGAITFDGAGNYSFN